MTALAGSRSGTGGIATRLAPSRPRPPVRLRPLVPVPVTVAPVPVAPVPVAPVPVAPVPVAPDNPARVASGRLGAVAPTVAFAVAVIVAAAGFAAAGAAIGAPPLPAVRVAAAGALWPHSSQYPSAA